MKFSTAIFALSSAVGAFAINSFTTPIGNETLHAGDTFIIRWNNTNGGDTVDLLLKKGNASNLETALTISTGLKNVGAVRWFLPEDLYTGSDYALQITNKDNANDINYSPFFTIIGKDPVTTTSTTSSSSTKKSSTKTSSTSTEASTTADSTTTDSAETTTDSAETTTAANSTIASTVASTSSFSNTTVVASSTGSNTKSASASHSSGASHSASASASGSASRSAAASGTTTAAGTNGASVLSLNNAVIAVGIAGAAFLGL
ncbi:hypothetical protein D0Z03_002695 [Geotrichum reessii]|nr:hypothetical protein D0Z03_002695 [Galactomyces reessii]